MKQPGRFEAGDEDVPLLAEWLLTHPPGCNPKLLATSSFLGRFDAMRNQ